MAVYGNVIPFPGPQFRGMAESQSPWSTGEDDLDAIRMGVWALERSELTQAGIAMAEHVEDALKADAEADFLDAAQTAFSLFERILVEAGRPPHPLPETVPHDSELPTTL